MPEEGRPPSPGYEPLPFTVSGLPPGIHATFTYITPGQQAQHKKCPSPISKQGITAPYIHINADAGLPHGLQPVEIKPESSGQEGSRSSGPAVHSSRRLRPAPVQVKTGCRDAAEDFSPARNTPSSLEDVQISSSPHHSSASPTPRHALSRFGPRHQAFLPDAGLAGCGSVRPASPEHPDHHGTRRVRPRHSYLEPTSVQTVYFDAHIRRWHAQLPVSNPWSRCLCAEDLLDSCCRRLELGVLHPLGHRTAAHQADRTAHQSCSLAIHVKAFMIAWQGGPDEVPGSLGYFDTEEEAVQASEDAAAYFPDALQDEPSFSEAEPPRAAQVQP